MTRFLRTTVTALALTTIPTHPAKANDCYSVKKVVCYETYTTFEIHVETYKKCVTRYDECGEAYVVEVICKREVKVPVKKAREVVKYVKVNH